MVSTLQSNRLMLLPTIKFPLSTAITDSPLPIHKDDVHRYIIEDVCQSENAYLLFTHHYVIKILRPFQDKRYQLSLLDQRHRCLIEGLEWNRKFANHIHLGLAQIRIWNAEWRQIGLGPIQKDLSFSQLDENVEYALVMQKLPKHNRLDCLLEKSPFLYEYFGLILIQFLCYMHSQLPAVDGNASWGSTEQLQSKLFHNLDVVNKPLQVEKSIKESKLYQELKQTGKAIEEIVNPIFESSTFRSYFAQRVERCQIKRCHGDLKARNIWIIPSTNYAYEWESVALLDAIDFNPDYCYIDTLSDLAMLVADLRTRMQSVHLAQKIAIDYLNLTGQVDTASRFVLDYYLIEKAFVGAYVSILYDKSPALGALYLESTRAYLQNFHDTWLSPSSNAGRAGK